MSRKPLNVTLEPDTYEEFSFYASSKGIKVSAWINAKMKEFIEEEKEARAEKEALKRKHS